MPLVSGRVDKEDEWAVYRIERDLFCGQMIHRCHRIERAREKNLTERQSDEGKKRWADRQQRAHLQSDSVSARCAKFTGTVVAWINCWKAMLKGFSNT